MKRVLILCTGNSCRSIMAEGLINSHLSEKGLRAFSAGSRPVGFVDDNAKRILEIEGVWDDEVYYSKGLESVEGFAPFDLIVTVCDSAKDSCPNYPDAKKQFHIGFRDPSGGTFEDFQTVKEELLERLLPEIEKSLINLS
jgi:arsenate reductase